MKIFKNAVVLAVILPFAAACATGSDETQAGPDWSKSTTINVKTGHGDRVAFRVLGNEKDGFAYHARIRHTTRSDPDPLDRQRVLSDAVRTVATRICKNGGKSGQPQYASNNYEQLGRITCSVR